MLAASAVGNAVAAALEAGAKGVAHQAGSEVPALSEKAAELLREFTKLVESYRSRFFKKGRLASSPRELIEELDYWSYLVQEHSRPEIARWKYGNVEALTDSISSYEEDPDNPDPNLYEYLNRVTLVTRDNLEEARRLFAEMKRGLGVLGQIDPTGIFSCHYLWRTGKT